MFLPLMISAFTVSVMWEYVPAFRTLGRRILEALFEFPTDEAALLGLGFLLCVCVLVAALRFLAHLIADLIADNSHRRFQTLGLK